MCGSMCAIEYACVIVCVVVWLDVKDSNGHYKDCFYGEKIV